MPVYEYGCLDCGATTRFSASGEEIEAGLKPVCPNCAGRNLVRLPEDFNESKSPKRGPFGCGCCG